MRRVALLVVLFPAPAGAQPDDGWPYAARCDVAVDAGLAVGFPVALPTGLATGVGAGVLRGRTLAWGARASWTTATEASEAWNVTHRDLRARVLGAVQHAAGRGTLALRVGLGATLLHERRTRHQAMRAGVEGEESALALLPLATLEGAIQLHVRGPWSMVLAGGPTLVIDGGARAGWAAEIGVAWQP